MQISQEEILDKTVIFVKEAMKTAESGHDWWHISRVLSLAETISKSTPNCDTFLVKMIALLHDIDDWKFAETSEKSENFAKTAIFEKTENFPKSCATSKKSEFFLHSLNFFPQKTVDFILSSIEKVSYKGASVSDETESIEGKIVQDADRLDALGAIGIARCFSYGGYRNREMYNPEKKAKMHGTFEEYKGNNDGTSINHFYEKLLLLKDRMKTVKGRELAEERHVYMKVFLEEFMKEWEGKA